MSSSFKYDNIKNPNITQTPQEIKKSSPKKIHTDILNFYKYLKAENKKIDELYPGYSITFLHNPAVTEKESTIDEQTYLRIRYTNKPEFEEGYTITKKFKVNYTKNFNTLFFIFENISYRTFTPKGLTPPFFSEGQFFFIENEERKEVSDFNPFDFKGKEIFSLDKDNKKQLFKEANVYNIRGMDIFSYNTKRELQFFGNNREKFMSQKPQGLELTLLEVTRLDKLHFNSIFVHELVSNFLLSGGLSNVKNYISSLNDAGRGWLNDDKIIVDWIRKNSSSSFSLPSL